MASWVLIGFLNISRSHLHSLTFVHSLVLPLALNFYPPPDRNFFLLQIATFAEGKFKCICRAVVSDFFSAILLDIPAEQFWWNIDLIGEEPAFVTNPMYDECDLTAFVLADPFQSIPFPGCATAVDIIDQLSTTFKICLCTMYTDNFLDYPSQLYCISKEFYRRQEKFR